MGKGKTKKSKVTILRSLKKEEGFKLCELWELGDHRYVARVNREGVCRVWRGSTDGQLLSDYPVINGDYDYTRARVRLSKLHDAGELPQP